MTTLRIEGEMTIYRAAELRHVLADSLEPGAPCEIDLSGVTDVDTTAVQLLLSARRSAAAAGSELRFVGHSPAVLEVLGLLNLSADLI